LNISPTDFASLLCSRLCHDLLSPVGALNNGLELLADEHDPEMRVRVLELLSESAKASANKLKFFRLAFGAAGGFGETVDTREAQAALEGLFGDTFAQHHSALAPNFLTESDAQERGRSVGALVQYLLSIDEQATYPTLPGTGASGGSLCPQSF